VAKFRDAIVESVIGISDLPGGDTGALHKLKFVNLN
jgi:hypothetical protein